MKPQLLLRLKRSLRRLDLVPRRAPPEPEPMDMAWRDMLDRLDAGMEDERRLADAEKALNRLS